MTKRVGQEIFEDVKFQVTTYNRPQDLCVTRGHNDMLYDDVNGKQFIDFTAGIAVTALGHSNEKIADILSKQARKLVHSSNLYYSAECLELSEKIVDKTKQFQGQFDASKVFLCNSGHQSYGVEHVVPLHFSIQGLSSCSRSSSACHPSH